VLVRRDRDVLSSDFRVLEDILRHR
jgi:hypothetical protein